MTISHRYVGIDISKDTLDIGYEDGSKLPQIKNKLGDVDRFLAALPQLTTVVFEATGAYGRLLEKRLTAYAIAFVKVNPGRARDFARATSLLAKTNAIDAHMLARMGRSLALVPSQPRDDEREHLNDLTVRRDQLVATRSDEARRLKTAADGESIASLKAHITWLTAGITRLEGLIKKALASATFKETRQKLTTAPGIALINAAVLIAQLPELGQRSAKTIAALVGLAPFNNDSGRFRGQRHIRGGRRRVRRALYVAAVTAVRKDKHFKAIYDRIRARSGHVKVALVAVARKLLIALNAMMKSGQNFQSNAT